MTASIQRLVDHDLVARTPSSDDRRCVRLDLTQEGRSRLSSAFARAGAGDPTHRRNVGELRAIASFLEATTSYFERAGTGLSNSAL